MALTDTAVRNTKPSDRPLKIFDERGLFLLVTPRGGKWWRLKYRFGGREKLLSLGVYPDVPLKLARERRDEARRLLAIGTDPSENKKANKAARQERAANSFEVVAREWFAKMTPNWVEHHGNRIIRRFERDIFPWIGSHAISDLTGPEVLSALRRIEGRGALNTAHRALQNCSQVFRYAVATGRAKRDPTSDLRGALPPVKGTHFAAVTEPAEVGKLLRVLDGYQGTFAVVCALKLAPLVFVRPGELRKAEWADIDFDEAQWRFKVTKTDTPHIVPLSTQAVEILRDLHALTGTGRFVFPGARTNARPMSDNAVLAAMRRMGVTKEEMCGHGFRAMARTILDERLGFRVDVIEHQMSHAVKDANGRAYNRTAHLDERRKMMQTWAEYLGQLKSGAQILTIERVA
jgi:integrase